jgi:hypothetical protein
VAVYFYGMVLWEMIVHKIPFDCQKPEILEDPLEGLAILIRMAWVHSPEDRPEFSQIIQEFSTGAISFAGCDQQKFLEKRQSVLRRSIAVPRRLKCQHHSRASLLD